MPRDQVFISYSHEDTKWREDLEKHLKPYLRAGSIKGWSDKQIVPGSKWFGEIQSALLQTNVAVLLVTPDFLASDFIHEHEIGPLLKEAERGGIKILWIPVRESAYKQTPLKNYQAVLDSGKPLASMTKPKRDQAWATICEEIKNAASQSGPDPPSETKPSAERQPDQSGKCEEAPNSLPDNSPSRGVSRTRIGSLHVNNAIISSVHFANYALIRFTLTNSSNNPQKVSRLDLHIKERAHIEKIEIKKAGALVNPINLEASIGDEDQIDLLAETPFQIFLEAAGSRKSIEALCLKLYGPEGFLFTCYLAAYLHDLKIEQDSDIISANFQVEYPIRSASVLKQRKRR